MTQGYVYDDSCIADQALAQFRVVVYGAAPLARSSEAIHVAYPPVQYANNIVGVTQYATATSGDTVLVRRAGISKVEVATGTVTAGAPLLAFDLVGRAAARVGAGVSGDGIVGQADQASSASGDIIECWLSIRQRN